MASFESSLAKLHILLGNEETEPSSAWKPAICQLINDTLADVRQVSDGLPMKTKIALTLELISHMMTKVPQLFVYCPQSGSQDTPGLSQLKPSQESEEEKQCYAMTCWVITHLLRVLPVTEPDMEPIHDSINDTIPSMLKMIKPRDPYVFKRLVIELVVTLADLAVIENRFYTEYLPDDFRAVVKRFAADFDQEESDTFNMESMVYRPVPVTDLKGCENLQISITKILTAVAIEVSQYANDLVSVIHNNNPYCLWATIGGQLEKGDLPLKLVSLELCEKLIANCGLPPAQVLVYVLSCLTSMADLICDPTNQQEDFRMLEKQFVATLSAVLSASDRLEVYMKDKLFVWQTLIQGLAACLRQHGLSSVRTKKFRDTICLILCDLFNKIPGHLSEGQMFHQARLDIARKLMSEIGDVQDAQHLEKYIANAIVSEMPAQEQAEAIITRSEETVVVVDGKEEPPRKRRLSVSSQSHVKPVVQCIEVDFTALMETSSVYEALMRKLLELVGNVCLPDKAKESYLCWLEGIRVILEAAVWSVSAVQQKFYKSNVTSPQSESALKITVFPPGVLNQVCKAWQHFLILCTTRAELVSVAAECYGRIIKSTGALLFAQEFVKIDSDIHTTCVWILTIPWLMDEMSWLDLKPRESVKDITKISKYLSEKVSSEIKGDCVYLLGLYPRDVAVKWRTQVLRIVSGDSSIPVKLATIRCFPPMLYHGGPNANHLVYEILHGLLNDKSPEVQQSLAEVMGPLACVVSRKAILVRAELAMARNVSYFSVLPKCVSCDKMEAEDQGSMKGPSAVDPNMFSPFMDLLNTRNAQLKIAMMHSTQTLFNHVGSKSSNATILKMLNLTLALLQDPDYNVRLAFSGVVPGLVGRTTDGEPSEMENVIISHIKTSAKFAQESSDPPLLHTILLTVGQMAKVADGRLLLYAIVILFDNIFSPSFALASAVARTQISEVADQKKLKMRNLFLRFGKPIAKLLIDNLHDAYQKREEGKVMTILEEMADVFEYENVPAFVKAVEHLLLPELVRKASPSASAIIKLLAKQAGDPNRKGPLARNIRHIYSHLVQKCPPKELLEVCNYLEGASEWDMRTLLRSAQHIDSELLLHFSNQTQRVLHGMKIFVRSIGKYDTTEDITDECLVEFLRPKLLGILVHFDNFLNKGTVPIEEKKEAYESVISLMKLMGSRNITVVRVRIMTTLKIGLKFKEKGFPELCCKAWNCFVHLVEVASVGPMLSQIVVSLLPLLQILPKQVADLFNYLIIENRKSLQQHFHELYFLPDIPELADAQNIIKKYANSNGSQNLTTQIESLLKGVCHESLDVRQLALHKLKHLLHNNQGEIQNMVLGHETADPIISQIIMTLLQGCRESSPAYRGLYGQCLGELGAIDPGRMTLMARHAKEDLTKFQSTIMDENFAVDLLNGLSKAFLRAEDRKPQDCVAFAIQEMIQIYGITPEEDSPGYRLWRRFSDDVQEIMLPLISSKYCVQVKESLSTLKKPIYGSRKGNTYSKWLCTLTCFLTSRVHQEQARLLFNKCCGVIEHDSQIALYLLPHLIVHVLLDGDQEAITDLSMEIETVLNHVKESDPHSASTTDLCHMSAQTIFSVLDHLTKWTRHRMMVLSVMAAQAAGGRTRATAHVDPRKDASYMQIQGFLEQVPQDVLAAASFKCDAYTRSLMHYEQFIKTKEQSIQNQEHLDFLQKLYVALDEPDGVAGITATKQSQITLGEQIMAYECIGQLSFASVCYDRAIQLEPNVLSYRQGMLRCRLALGELNSAMDLANGMVAARPEWTSHLNSVRLESAWKLGMWDKLEDYLENENNNRDWNVDFGKLLLAVRNKDGKRFCQHLNAVRNELMGPLSAASMEMGSYHRGYDYIVRLHILNELENGLRTLMDFPHPSLMTSGSQALPPNLVDIATLLKQWEGRLQFTQATYRTQEPILNVRRTLLYLAHSNTDDSLINEIGNCWLQAAKIARESGYLQTAHSSLLSAADYNLPEFALENARWLWDTGDYDKAQSCLEKAVETHYPTRAKFRAQSNPYVSTSERMVCAKMLLEIGRMSEETASLESNEIVKQYKEVKEVHSEWEDGYFALAKYYDKIMINLIDSDQYVKKGDFIVQVVNNFVLSLQYGNQYIYQSMPRMLTLWLDYGAEVSSMETSKNEMAKKIMRSCLGKLNNSIAECQNKLTPYQFLTAFPQLISRICHTHPDVFAQLREIIARLLTTFPQQAMWMMMAVSKSSYQMRTIRCVEIISRAKTLNTELNKFLQDATKLTDRLLDLCNRPVESGVSTLSINQHFKPLQRLINDRNFSPILLPLQNLMMPTLPNIGTLPSKHDPFPGAQVYIKGIEDVVEVLASLQKPKKITLRGSDGKLYVMLCKPKDDLRKDARLMEFNAIVNRLLRKDGESRRRNLQIRTFTVTPLNEECGMLEWVSNTAGFRNILLKIYRERGVYTSGKDLKSMQLPPNASIEMKRSTYLTRLVPRHPALFSEWFLKTFPDPTSWYNARLAYCRTAAVMSMVGYILGLGDRHGENILLDSTSGDCVHVDFNCLFNKGLTFEYPEIVPFRLTHNMVEAMGPMGYEGIFRRACEVTLRVMRDQMDPLMSVLRPFIYDPLVEWSKPTKGKSNAMETGEIKNEKAQTNVNNIEDRLKGVLKKKTKPMGLPLSVDGHVNHLIKEATSVDNLSQMYIGWAAYM